MLKRLASRAWAPVQSQLKRGLDPDQAAWACAVGLYLTVIPALGVSTLLCLLAGWAFRLNHAILQGVSWAAYPLQFVLLFPFYEAGAWAFQGPRMTLSPAEFSAKLSEDAWGLARELWWVGVHAIGVWAVLGLLAVPLLWLGFRALLGRAKAAVA